MNHQGAHFRIYQEAHFRIWEGMQEGMWEGMREGIRERMRERIPEPLIGSERSHDLVSAPASAPASTPISAPESDWIGRSVTANGRRERIGSGCGSGFSNF